MKKNYYVTTPIYYVNDKPHIGHMYTNLAADILARFKRLDGYQVIFLTGTDEHGQKVEKSAKKSGEDTKKFVDKVSLTFRDLSKLLNLSNDDFIRTTEERHIKAVEEVWLILQENGYIYFDTYKGWYALKDEAFYTKDELVKNSQGQLVAPSGAEVQWHEEESYFFKLSAFQEKLLEYYKTHPNFIAPKSRANEVIRFVKGGLKDLSISRSNFSWGIKVPNNEHHIIYVWLDALVNYISALDYPLVESKKFQEFWLEGDILHLIGKDILRFHCVYWPAFLMAANLPLPTKIFGHGWWLNEGQKISKSLNNTLDPYDLVTKYGVDQVRYFLFKEVNFGNDADFSHESIVSRINNELANEYGNLIQRTLSIINNSFNGELKSEKLGEVETNYLLELDKKLEEFRGYIENQNFLSYLDKCFEIIRYGNFYINKNTPWALIKEGNSLEGQAKNSKMLEAQNILYFICEIAKRVSILLNPFMPQSTDNILKQLNVPIEHKSLAKLTEPLPKKYKINQNYPIFAKYYEPK
ncbi:Methionine--tRNA ligase [Candidatus Hepatincolaceae symbiont of Richtersius coronifer]